MRFEVTAPPLHAGYCHCTRCQRRTGTAASANVAIDGESFRLLTGEELVQGWRHPDGGWEKCFCRRCGAHLFSRNPDDRARMGIRMSAFDSGQADQLPRPRYRQFTAYAASWEPIPDDGLERFPEGRPQAKP